MVKIQHNRYEGRFWAIKKFKTQMGFAKINDPLSAKKVLRTAANGFLSRFLSGELTAKSAYVAFLTTFKEILKIGSLLLTDTIKTQR